MDDRRCRPERVPVIITSGAWDPRPEEPPETSEYNEALRRGGTRALVELFKLEDGDSFDREFPSWARAVTLRGDPEALLAAGALERWTDGIPDEDLRSFPARRSSSPGSSMTRTMTQRRWRR